MSFSGLTRTSIAHLLLIGAMTAAGFALVTHLHPVFAAEVSSQPTPVLVELFTSEGCSDCPPADALLQSLDTTQFVPGAVAIVLSEHVTYWNRLGWRDPFSLDAMDVRQQDYSARFGLNSVYTPQMVVDGKDQFVGSDRKALTSAVQKAASTTKLPVEILESKLQDGKVGFSLKTGADNSNVHWYAALAEDATHSEVARGENAGRTLHHVAVVRVMHQLNRIADRQSLTLPVERNANADSSLRLVVFAIDPRSGKVVAATQRKISN